jgi:GNAT superfamily N-acetyltransferase
MTRAAGYRHGVESRSAGPRDVQGAAATLADAFSTDPVWSWAFADRDHLEVWWRFWVAAAVPQGSVRVTEGIEAVSVWIPPGGHECPPEDEAHVGPLVRALAGPRADLVLETLDRFEANHPHDVPPHYYLSLLGTASPYRGRGLGMALLASGLARIDEQHMPAYLESSNPVNLGRYESVGFEPRGEFTLPEGNVTVTTMWRAPA